MRSWMSVAVLAGGLLLAGAAPDPIPPAARQKLAGLPVDCQKAYASMRACLEKTIAAGASETIRPQWEKQLDDTLTSWQALKGQPGLQQVCREIAANPDCAG